ncbi:aminotransferase class V-fold PLP-dependent enzyme [Pseudooceanicola sediminis]|nr:aminotransferase class V-fold PLP-dependent enzyme [Pseudooceanicola sediminis]
MADQMGLDIEALRAATPALPGVVHFNAASSGLVPRAVLEAMQAHLQAEAALAPHEAGVAVADAIEAARAAAARLIGARAEEVALTTGSSQAWNAAFHALPALQGGDRVLVGAHEWGGNVFTLVEAARRSGAVIETIPTGPDGRMDTGALAAMMDDRVRLIAVTWVPAHLGIAEPVAEVGQIARAAGVPYLLDAAQALGLLPCDVGRIGCDMLTAPGRKALRGPKGTGVLYVRQGCAATPGALNVRAAGWQAGKVVLRRDAARFESNEYAPAPLLGLGVALGLALDLRVEEIRRATFDKVAALRAGLSGVAGVSLRESGVVQSHITTFTHARMTPAEVMQALRAQGVTINAVPAHYGPLSGLAGPVCRASVSYLTTQDEIARLCAVLGAL